MNSDTRSAILAGIFETNSCYVHPVTFEMIFEDLDWSHIIDTTFHGVEFSYDEKALQEVTWDTIAFDPAVTTLEVFSKQTGNTEVRGGGCGCRYTIPVEDFRYTITNKTGITLKNLVEGVYRMKGSKYDNWYESFSDIVVTQKSSSHVEVEAKFEYGS
ncbi:hypothetical protein BH23THE1_BH23THE1_34700 [soil metagenome]